MKAEAIAERERLTADLRREEEEEKRRQDQQRQKILQAADHIKEQIASHEAVRQAEAEQKFQDRKRQAEAQAQHEQRIREELEEEQSKGIGNRYFGKKSSNWSS